MMIRMSLSKKLKLVVNGVFITGLYPAASFEGLFSERFWKKEDVVFVFCICILMKEFHYFHSFKVILCMSIFL